MSKSQIDQVLLQKVDNDFFKGNPVSYEITHQGQRLDGQGNIVLGGNAGDTGVDNLLHEMSHLAEREKHKIVLRPVRDWDFSYGKYWSFGRASGYEPSTDQAVRRELRVWAFQASIQEHYGMFIDIQQDVRDLVRSAVFISGWCYYAWKNFQSDGKPDEYDRQENDAINRAADEVYSLSQSSFTFARFCEDWEDRMRLLKRKVD